MTEKEHAHKSVIDVKSISDSDRAYISSLYGNRRTVVSAFLRDKSKLSTIEYRTALDIYEIIELKLGYPIPLKQLKKKPSNSRIA